MTIPAPRKIAVRHFQFGSTGGIPSIKVVFDFQDINGNLIEELVTENGQSMSISLDAPTIKGSAGHKNLKEAIVNVIDCLEDVMHFSDPKDANKG
jgi:hypothetical protein